MSDGLTFDMLAAAIAKMDGPGRNGNGKGSPAGGLADFDAMIAQFTDGGSNGQH